MYVKYYSFTNMHIYLWNIYVIKNHEFNNVWAKYIYVLIIAKDYAQFEPWLNSIET